MWWKVHKLLDPKQDPRSAKNCLFQKWSLAPQKCWISEVSELGNTLQKNSRRCTKKILISCNDTSIFSKAWSSAEYLKNWTKIQGISIQLLQTIPPAQEKWSNDSRSFSNKKVVKLVPECDWTKPSTSLELRVILQTEVQDGPPICANQATGEDLITRRRRSTRVQCDETQSDQTSVDIIHKIWFCRCQKRFMYICKRMAHQGDGGGLGQHCRVLPLLSE